METVNTAECIAKLNLVMDRRCIPFLDRYWSGEDVTTDREDVRLYNDLCGKQMKEMFIAIFTHSLPRDCQIKYFDMLCKNCSSAHVLGVTHGKKFRNFLEIFGPGHYFPLMLSFASFSISDKNSTYINYQVYKKSTSPFIIAAWHKMELLKSDPTGLKDYFIWWKKKTKIFHIYKLLTIQDIQSEHSVIIKMAGLNQLEHYIKNLMKGMLVAYFENSNFRVTLIQSLLIGFVVRNITNKESDTFKLRLVHKFVEDFKAYTGNLLTEQALKNLLVTICRSKFAKIIMRIKKLKSNSGE